MCHSVLVGVFIAAGLGQARPDDLPAARHIGVLRHTNAEAVICGITYAPSGQAIAAADSPGGTVQIWETSTGRRIRSFDLGLDDYRKEPIFLMSADFRQVAGFRSGWEKGENIQGVVS